MKVKTDFKQMVLVDHILYNKLNNKTKPDVHIQHVRTPIINPISSNSIQPPPPNYPNPPTAPSSDDVSPPPPNDPAPPTAPISEPNPSIPFSNNDWEKQAHQWIDTFQLPNYMSYNDNMDKSVQIGNDTNAVQSEAIEYTNTPQRAGIESSAPAPSQISVEKPMEVDYNQTPSIANEIKKAVEQEKRLHIEYAPPLPLKTQLTVQQPGHLNILQPQRMELDYYTPRSITQTMTLPSLPAPPTHPSLPAPPTHLSLPAPPTHPSLPAPPTHLSLPAPLSITQKPASSSNSSKDEECDECANTVEYEDKLPIAYETNDTKALIPYNDYISMTAKPVDARKKNVFLYMYQM